MTDFDDSEGFGPFPFDIAVTELEELFILKVEGEGNSGVSICVVRLLGTRQLLSVLPHNLSLSHWLSSTE
jgi:hypothetical protein